MKRTLTALFIICLCLSVLCGCSDSPKYIHEDNGKYTITLPSSNETLEVEERYEYYVSRMTDELIENAEKKLEEKLAPYSSDSGYYLSVDREGYLCLTVEVIVSIDPPTDANEEIIEAGGCGIDHEHVMFRERISE